MESERMNEQGTEAGLDEGVIIHCCRYIATITCVLKGQRLASLPKARLTTHVPPQLARFSNRSTNWDLGVFSAPCKSNAPTLL